MNWHTHDANVKKHDAFVSALQMWAIALPPNLAALEVRHHTPDFAGKSCLTISPAGNPGAPNINIVLDELGTLELEVKEAGFFREVPINTQVVAVCDAIVSGRLHETRWEWRGRTVGRVAWVDVSEDCRLNSDSNHTPAPLRRLLPGITRHDIAWPSYDAQLQPTDVARAGRSAVERE